VYALEKRGGGVHQLRVEQVGGRYVVDHVLEHLLPRHYHLLNFAERRRHVVYGELATYLAALQLVRLLVYDCNLRVYAPVHVVKRLVELLRLDVKAVKHLVDGFPAGDAERLVYTLLRRKLSFLTIHVSRRPLQCTA